MGDEPMSARSSDALQRESEEIEAILDCRHPNPLAAWLHRVADHLDDIHIRYQHEDTGRWYSPSLAELPPAHAAAEIAEFLNRWPFIPVRVVRPSERVAEPVEDE
jgi:hypothetical protein